MEYLIMLVESINEVIGFCSENPVWFAAVCILVVIGLWFVTRG